MQPLLLKGTLIDFWPVDKKHSKLGRLLVLAKKFQNKYIDDVVC